MNGSLDVVKGRIEEGAGVLTDNDSLRAKGRTDQAVGHVKQAGEKGIRQAKEPCTKERSVKTRVGLWIDHRKAVVVAVTDGGGETTLTILSHVERHPGRSGEKHPVTSRGSQQAPADGSRQRRFTGQLDIYYDAVIACVRNAGTILIFGPGEAKGEFRRRIMKAGIRARIEEAETVDKMTDRQIAAKVRRHFQKDPSSSLPAGQHR